MSQLIIAILASLAAGAMMPLGAALATVERIRPRWLEEEFRHGVIAFGGGALLAAVALVLVPGGAERLSAPNAVAAFMAGGLALFVIDRVVSTRFGRSAQLMAMLTDFVPEAIALGAMFASGGSGAVLLAVLIGLQNLPEGFNAYRERRAATGSGPRTILPLFLAMALLGPAAAAFGHLFLADHQPILGALMLFAAGGILYLTFQDIAVEAHLKRDWAPSLGAVGGFGLGLLGHMLMG